jgi:glycosyltransferase involved in cell wall biosynthesis
MAEQIVADTGLLVPRGDGDALGDAVLTAISSPDTLKRWGQNAFERAQTLFSVQRMAQDYEELLAL